MKKRMIQPAMAAGIAIILSACTHYYYAPNTANIPLFKEKNTMKIKGGYSSGDNYNGADIQLAYSVSPKIGIMFNSFFAGNTEDVDTNGNSNYTHTETGKGSLFEMGVGYYKPFHEKRWIFEMYAGGGPGSEHHSFEGSQEARLKLFRYFIQPSIGYSSSSGTLEIAVASRFSGLNLKVKESNVSANGGNNTDKSDLDHIALRPSSALWEPSLLVSAGWPNFKFYLQLTKSQNLNNVLLPQDETNFSIGIRFNVK